MNFPKSLHRHAFRQITRLIHITAAQQRNVVGEELQRHDRDQRLQVLRHVGDVDHFVINALLDLDLRLFAGDIRNDIFAWMDQHKFQYVPSVSNCFMVDVKRPGREVIEAMRRDKVYIGRVWPSWPTYVRVTVGTKDEMEKFKAAFLKVMA